MPGALMEPSVIGLGVVVLFLAAIAAGFPVFIAMGMAALIGNAAIGGFWHALQNAALRSYQGLDSFVLLAVPLYVLTGTLLQATDLSGRLFRAAAAWTACPTTIPTGGSSPMSSAASTAPRSSIC